MSFVMSLERSAHSSCLSNAPPSLPQIISWGPQKFFKCVEVVPDDSWNDLRSTNISLTNMWDRDFNIGVDRPGAAHKVQNWEKQGKS